MYNDLNITHTHTHTHSVTITCAVPSLFLDSIIYKTELEAPIVPSLCASPHIEILPFYHMEHHHHVHEI